MVTSLEGTGSNAGYSTAPLAKGGGGAPAADVEKTAATKISDGVSVAVPKENTATEQSVNTVVSQFVALQSEKDAANDSAQAVHQLDTARAVVDQLRESLNRIVKMYPPYAKDDPARAQLMQSVIGLRQVTEKLTIPPAYNQLLQGATDLPGVQSVDASDAQVADALASLNAVSDTYAAESKKLFDSAVPGAGVIVGEQAAGQQSQKVGSGLSATGAGISSEPGRELIQSLAG